MSQTFFIEARQRYWKQLLARFEPQLNVNCVGAAPFETNFILFAEGRGGSFAAFEDDGTTGYLYVFDNALGEVVQHLHLYDRSPSVDVRRDDVRVLWSKDGDKCGVAVWGTIRGIIDLARKREGRVWLEGRTTPGIGDVDWLDGFPQS